MTAWENSGYVMADLGLLRNLQLHAAVSFGFRIVTHQTRTVWLSRYFPLRYDGNISAWLVAPINFWVISHTGGVSSPAQVHVSIDTLLCVHLIGKLHIFEWNSDIVELISYINNFTKSVNMELAMLIYNDNTHFFLSWLFVAGCKWLRPIRFTYVSRHRIS
jgi:hypothetical protein